MTDIELATAQLEWLCTAPDLILPPETLMRPRVLDQLPPYSHWKLAPVLRGCETLGRGRLGRQFENLIEIHLQLNPQVSDIKRNIQIKKDGVTLGELDFMIRTPHEWVHLEVAVKFYLLDGDGWQLDHFIGPGRADKLGAKWRRMITHQLPVAHSQDGVNTLHSLNIDQFRQAVWIKGALFYHWQQTETPALPELINPCHDKGWWVRCSELAALQQQLEIKQFRLISKPDWLIPSDRLPLSRQQMLMDDQLATLQRPVMLTARRADGTTTRGFLVPDDWGRSLT